MTLKQIISRHLTNLPGWRTNRKIVVIESDDWGSIRLSSKTAYEQIKKSGIDLDGLSFNRYDSLASEQDLELLFMTLSGFKDKNGNHPKITANTIMTNPDFDKIEQSNFTEYYYEPFTETLKKYPEHKGAFKLWHDGIKQGLFKPQLHGREHLNVKRWLDALKLNNKKVHLAFRYRMFDLSTSLTIDDASFMEALNFESENELDYQRSALSEAARLFEETFGYKSLTFIAPCYVWSSKLNETLLHAGVIGFQGGWWQLEPIPGKAHRFRKKLHFTGQKNALGQVFTVRNAYCEPLDNPSFDWVNAVIKRAEIAFKWGKPLIISSHRVNYIGYIDPSNRDRNLLLLKTLLKELLSTWPDIEFFSSDELIKLINKKHDHCT